MRKDACPAGHSYAGARVLPDGSRLCMPCRRASQARYQARHPERGKTYRARPEVKAHAKAYRAAYWRNPENQKRKKTRAAKLHREQYFASYEEFLAMFEAQGGCCAICNRRLRLWVPRRGESNSDRACVDHDHASGRTRGILCSPCNSGIGLFGDDEERLEAAVKYLASFRERR